MTIGHGIATLVEIDQRASEVRMLRSSHAAKSDQWCLSEPSDQLLGVGLLGASRHDVQTRRGWPRLFCQELNEVQEVYDSGTA